MRTFTTLLILSACAAAVAEEKPQESILFNASYGERLPGSTDGVGLWWASSGWKVSQDRPMPGRRGKAIEITAARNETEAAQLVVRPARELTGVTAFAAALTGPSGSIIPAESVEILRVRYVPIALKSDREGALAPWPDPLPPFVGPITLAAGMNQPLWVRVHVPREVAPGRYRGILRLTADGYSAEVPLTVTVYDFDLPDRTTCSTAFGFSPGLAFQYQNVTDEAQKRSLLEKYWQTLGAHHITPYDPAPLDGCTPEWVKIGENDRPDLDPADRALMQQNALTPVFDWTAWDREMLRVFDTYHFTSFRLGIPGLNRPNLCGFDEGTREYTLAFNTYCQTVQEHLRETGLLDEAYVYWYDEPTEGDYGVVMNGFRKLETAAPDIRRMLTEQVEPGLIGGPNLWCPLTMWYKHEAAQQRRAAGDHFWWYVCTIPKRPYPGLFIDHPATDFRVWLWQTWQHLIEGILIWASNLWTTDTAYPDAPQNPYEDAMSWMTGYGTKPGDKKPWGNGDGRFLYPPEAAATPVTGAPCLDTPVDTIRIEMLRDGIEDYEYLALLKRLIEQHGG
ncbi:MAG: hypothetical protein QG656_881, partial [Candidatus Hydrogenedentes bacterium]|nr:hypothetical protein [Candidatus Hydrogenedentota bacterium]